jgi:hypothetical protein
MNAPSITNPNNGISYSQPPSSDDGRTARLRYFGQANKDCTEAAQQVATLMERESALKQMIALRKVDLETLEAQWIAEGKVTGANAEQRKACVALLARDDEDYKAVRTEQIAEEAELGRVIAALELARDTRSIAKRRMEMVIAVTNLDAASQR